MHATALLAARVSELNGNARTVLTVYMTWYTFYWILNGSVLAWQYGHEVVPVPLICGFFLLMAIPATMSSFVIARTITGMSSEIDILSRAVADSGAFTKPDDGEAFARALWPKRALWWGLGVNGAATLDSS